MVVTNEAGTEICRKDLGDFTRSGEQDQVIVECDSAPYTISYEIDRDPCGPATAVFKNVYDPEQDIWREERIECE